MNYFWNKSFIVKINAIHGVENIFIFFFLIRRNIIYCMMKSKINYKTDGGKFIISFIESDT